MQSILVLEKSIASARGKETAFEFASNFLLPIFRTLLIFGVGKEETRVFQFNSVLHCVSLRSINRIRPIVRHPGKETQNLLKMFRCLKQAAEVGSRSVLRSASSAATPALRSSALSTGNALFSSEATRITCTGFLLRSASQAPSPMETRGLASIAALPTAALAAGSGKAVRPGGASGEALPGLLADGTKSSEI